MGADHTLTTVSDEELCLLCANGSAEAEEALVVRYQGLVRRCSRALFLMGGDQEDLIQEGMLALVLAVRSYRRERGAGFSTYAYQCVRNRMVSAVRAAASGKHEALNSALPLDCALSLSDERSMEQRLIREDSLKGLQAMLTPLEAQVLELYLTGMSYRQISRRLNRSGKSVDNAVQRIRKKWEAHLHS